MHQGGIRPTNPWNKNKSISEANLIAAEYNRGYHPNIRDPRRNSVAEFGHPHDVVDHVAHTKPDSHLSVPLSRRGHSVIRNDYLSQEEDTGTSFIYPHLQVLNIRLLFFY